MRPRYRRRQVGPAIRSNRMRISLSSVGRQIHTVVHGSTASFPIYQIGGFANVAKQLQFYIVELGMVSRLGANPPVAFGDQFSNAASLAIVFDQFRIVKVQCDVYYTNNSSGVNNALQLPMLFGVIDKDDNLPLTNAANALAYSSCKTMQLGNSSGDDGGKQTLYLNGPGVITDAANTGGSAGPTTLAAIVKNSPWVDCAQLETPHFGFKFFTETTGVTNTQVGNVTFVFRVFTQYKNLR